MANFKRAAILDRKVMGQGDDEANKRSYLLNTSSGSGSASGYENDVWVGFSSPKDGDVMTGMVTTISAGQEGKVDWCRPSKGGNNVYHHQDAFCAPGKSQGGLGKFYDNFNGETAYTPKTNDDGDPISGQTLSGGGMVYFNGLERGSKQSTTENYSDLGNHAATFSVAHAGIEATNTYIKNEGEDNEETIHFSNLQVETVGTAGAAPVLKAFTWEASSHNHDEYHPTNPQYITRVKRDAEGDIIAGSGVDLNYTTAASGTVANVYHYQTGVSDLYVDVAGELDYASATECDAELVGTFGSGDLNEWVLYQLWETGTTDKPVVFDSTQPIFLGNGAWDSADMVNVPGGIVVHNNLIAINPALVNWQGTSRPADDDNGDADYHFKGFLHKNFDRYFDGFTDETGQAWGTSLTIEDGSITVGPNGGIFARDNDTDDMVVWDGNVTVNDAQEMTNFGNSIGTWAAVETTEDTFTTPAGANEFRLDIMNTGSLYHAPNPASFIIHSHSSALGAPLAQHGTLKTLNADGNEYASGLYFSRHTEGLYNMPYIQAYQQSYWVPFHGTYDDYENDRLPVGSTYVGTNTSNPNGADDVEGAVYINCKVVV